MNELHTDMGCYETRHEEYNHYPNNETELVEFLKYIQRGV